MWNVWGETAMHTMDRNRIGLIQSWSKKKEVKGRIMGLFQHCGRLVYCILTPNKFPHSSPEAPRIIQMRETSTSEGGNYYQ